MVSKFNKDKNWFEDIRGGNTSDHLIKEKIIEEIKEFLAQSRTWSCLEFSMLENSIKTTVYRYLTEYLQMKKLLNKWGSHFFYTRTKRT